MKFVATILISFLLCATVFSQSGRLKRADNYYSKLAYALAAQQYEGLIGSEVDSPAMKGKLAYCYYQVGNSLKSEEIYAQMVATPTATKDDIYHYAQTLKENGKYTESDEWMNKFVEKSPDDFRALDFRNKQNYLDIIEKQSNHFNVKRLAMNSKTADFGGYPSADQKDIYFISARSSDRAFVSNVWTWKNESFLDVHVGKKAGNEIETPKLITRKVNTKYHEGPLCFSPDNKLVYFTRNNIAKGNMRNDEKGIQNLKLYIAEVTGEGKWTNEREFPLNNREYSIGHPSISADGEYLYFSSDMPGGYGGADIYRVFIGISGTFGKPENMGAAINTESQEMFPWINSEGFLFFSSDGRVGLGGLDVFVVSPEIDGGIPRVINVGKPVNSQKDDFAFTMLNDNTTGYFSSNREGGIGEDDIFSFTMEEPFVFGRLIQGIAVDKEGNPLDNVVVLLRNEEGVVIQETTTDENGKYSILPDEMGNLDMVFRRKDYFDLNMPLKIDETSPITIEQNASLESDPGFSMYYSIRDRRTKEVLEKVKITLVDNFTSIKDVNYTDKEGSSLRPILDKKIGDKLSYSIRLEKEGYITRGVTFTSTLSKEGTYDISEELNINLEKISVGVDIGEATKIEPIYFDYNKFDIRPDAGFELEKIVKVMNEYPNMVVELGSHTDCRGTMVGNQQLSENRAIASASYIKSRISNPDRIYGKGYGEYKLKNGCGCEGAVKFNCSEQEHQQNRRTEFVIIKM